MDIRTKMLKELLANGWGMIRGTWFDQNDNQHELTLKEAYTLMRKTKDREEHSANLADEDLARWEQK